MKNNDLFKNIKLLILDVDGVLTDGRIYFSQDGLISRAYSVHDGYGIIKALKNGLNIAIISGAKSESVIKRAKSLGVKCIVTNREDKLNAYNEIVRPYFNISNENTAFIGDDVYDIELLKHVRLPITVPGACDEVKEVSKYICSKNGGYGAVREVIDLII